MNLNCVGFYFIKSSSSFRKDNSLSEWTYANISINAELDRYILEIKHVSDDDDIYDEDEDERGSMVLKMKLNDYKTCEQRLSQHYKKQIIHVLILIPKIFSKAKKLFLAFLSEEVQLSWYKNLDIILTNKFQNNKTPVITQDSISSSSVEEFMIDNDVYEGFDNLGEFVVVVIDNDKSKEIGIKGQYTMTVTETGLELRNESMYELIKVWEMKNIRKFGEKENIFFMELGKHCEEGSGFLSFKVTQIKAFWNQLLKCKENCLKHKETDAIIPKKLGKTQNDPTDSLKSESNRESVLSNMIVNRTYSEKEPRTLSIKENRKTLTQPHLVKPPQVPPSVAPPPIPSSRLIYDSD